jgi:ATP-dependent 26S proteasome regulatory subunit
LATIITKARSSFEQVDKAPTETYADIGGLESQIQEIKEAVELPLAVATTSLFLSS